MAGQRSSGLAAIDTAERDSGGNAQGNAVMWTFRPSEIADADHGFNRNNTMLLRKYIPFSRLGLITVHIPESIRWHRLTA